MPDDFLRNIYKLQYDSIAFAQHEATHDRLRRASAYVAKNLQTPKAERLTAYHLANIEEYAKKRAQMFGEPQITTQFAILTNLIRQPDFQNSPQNPNKTKILNAVAANFDPANKDSLKIIFRACASCLYSPHRDTMEGLLETCAKKANNLQVYETAHHLDMILEDLKTRRQTLRTKALIAQNQIQTLRQAHKTAATAQEKAQLKKNADEIKKTLFKTEDQVDRRQEILTPRLKNLFKTVLKGRALDLT